MNKAQLKIILWQSVAWCFLWFIALKGTLISFFMPVKINLGTRIIYDFVFIFLIVSLNNLVLIPKLYMKNRYVLFSLSTIGLFVAYVSLAATFELRLFNLDEEFQERIQVMMSLRQNTGNVSIPTPKMLQLGSKLNIISMLPPFLFAFCGSLIWEVLQHTNKKEIETEILKREKLVAEIKFLKTQINPHFLFNALNNIYALVMSNSTDAGNALHKLSNMLRYMVYETDEDRVTIAEEIAYVKDYISLMMLKDSGGLSVKTSFDITDPSFTIPPLILIPFIENAFKHSGIEDLEKGWICINLSVKNALLELELINSIKKGKPVDYVGGIGLSNVSKRLQMIYGDTYILDISKDESKYMVSLKLSNL